MTARLTTRQGVGCCAVSLIAGAGAMTLAILLAVTILGPETGDGATAEGIFAAGLLAIPVPFIVLYFAIAWCERRNEREGRR